MLTAKYSVRAKTIMVPKTPPTMWIPVCKIPPTIVSLCLSSQTPICSKITFVLRPKKDDCKICVMSALSRRDVRFVYFVRFVIWLLIDGTIAKTISTIMRVRMERIIASAKARLTCLFRAMRLSGRHPVPERERRPQA